MYKKYYKKFNFSPYDETCRPESKMADGNLHTFTKSVVSMAEKIRTKDRRFQKSLLAP